MREYSCRIAAVAGRARIMFPIRNAMLLPVNEQGIGRPAHFHFARHARAAHSGCTDIDGLLLPLERRGTLFAPPYRRRERWCAGRVRSGDA
jgi:hypothetical protein